MLQTFWWQNLLCLLLSSQVWSHYSSKPPTRQRLCPVLQPSVSTVMEKQYTFKGQSLENGLFCVLQALGNILLQRHKASMTTHRQQSTSAKSLSHVRLCETPWPVAHQVPLNTGFSRQEYQSRLPFPSPTEHKSYS